jgi:CHAT domain-containing protein/Tfp pilus assembly protein PilF
MIAVLRIRCLFGLLTLRRCSRPLLILLLAATSRAIAQTPLNTGDSVTSSHPLTVELHPREFQQITVSLSGGKYNEIRIESPGAWSRGVVLKAAPGVSTAPSPVTDPYISDSGESFVRIPKMAERDGPMQLQLTALSNSKADVRPVTATITLLVEDATPRTALTLKAINTFVHAERIRRDRGKAEDAIPAYDAALAAARELKDKVLEQRVLLSKARFLDLDGTHYADAVVFARQATEVDSEASASVRGLAWKTLGSACIDMDQYREGIAASQRSADLFRQAGDTFWLGIVLENLGEAYQTSGDLAEALTTDTDALQIARALKDDYGIIEMLSEIGAIHKDRAEYQEALNDFSAAVELTLPSTFNPMQAEAWSNLGELYTILGETDQALPAYQHALSIAQSTRDGIAELETLKRIGQLQLDGGEHDQAEQTFTHALARAQELKLTRQQSGLLTGLARSEVRAGSSPAAHHHIQQALDAATAIHQPYELADAHEAEAQLAQAKGDDKLAQTETEQANALWMSLPDNGRLAQGLSRLAELEVAEGRLEEASGHLAQAIRLIETSRGSLARGGLRTRYFALQHHTYDLAVFTAMQLDRAHPGADYAAKAWEIAESARARSLLDSLSNDDAGAVDPANRPLGERLAALGMQIEATQDKIAQLGTTAADLDTAAKLQHSLHQDLLEEQQLEARLSPASPEKASLGIGLTPASFAHRVLTPGAALLEYWEGERASYVWLIRQDGTLQAATLPRAARLQQQVDAYEKDLLARNAVVPNEDFSGRAERLAAADARLLQRAQTICAVVMPSSIRKPLGGEDTLLIVPDGSLLSIPFAALIEPGAKQYLIQKFRMVLEPSATAASVAAPLPAHEADGAERVVVFADPVYSASDGRLQAESATAPALAENATRGVAGVGLSHLPRLPGSRQEAMAIADVAGAENVSLHLGFEATPATVKSLDWKSYSVAHFAAHAVASARMPETSGIVLSMVDSKGKGVDGMLWLRDIRRLRLQENLVVLSGCGTGVGENVPGEGLNSLSRAFLESGARNVTATLWNADDAMSSRLMQSFYRGFLEGRTAAPAALRAAQLQMLNDPRHRSPYYWAGFTMEGAWQAQ